MSIVYRKLADIDEDGQLNAAEFAVALHLTQLALDGLLPPTSLPSSLRSLILKVLAPQEYIPTAKTNQIEKCQSAFLSFCENVSNTGYLSGKVCLDKLNFQFIICQSVKISMIKAFYAISYLAFLHENQTQSTCILSTCYITLVFVVLLFS